VTLASNFEVSYSDLQGATHQFSRAMQIGGGGSCEVFRGVLYKVDVAVKVLKQARDTPGNGTKTHASSSESKQFFAEMNLLRAVQHPNICRLLAVSSDGPHRW
jgi:serine/threonine protein kinase